MSTRKILILITAISIAVGIVCCVSSCEKQVDKGLQFVGGDKSRQNSTAVKGLVIVTHGWIEKGRGSWPEDMAAVIHNRVQHNNWLCGYFDWSKGAQAINPTDAAKYARDAAGPGLAKEIIELGNDFQHIHLTFFDAYVPSSWQERSLGDIRTSADSNCWVDHYYTRDYTLGFTEQNLSNAHNVDVTSIDQLLKDHNFPWKWYYASVTGKYPKGTLLDNSKLALTAEGIEYGFARSREAGGSYSWGRSLELPRGNAAVKFKKP